MSSERIPVSWIWPPAHDPLRHLPAISGTGTGTGSGTGTGAVERLRDLGPVAVGRLQLGRDVLRRRLAEAGTRRRSRRPPAQGWQRRRDLINSSLSRSRVSAHGRRRR